MSSKRMPGKVLKNLGNSINSISLIIRRIKLYKLNYKIIVITSKKKINDIIEKTAKKLNVLCFRGSENNVLKRLRDATIYEKENSIIQLTADNPLIDIDLINYLVKKYSEEFPKIDFLTNNNLFNKTITSPLGMKASIIQKKSLEQIYKLAKKKDALEHPTLYFYREGKNKFKIKNLSMPNKWVFKDNPRFTLDTKKDLIFIKKIFKLLRYKVNFKAKDLKKILINNKNILKINKSIKQKIPKILKN